MKHPPSIIVFVWSLAGIFAVWQLAALLRSPFLYTGAFKYMHLCIFLLTVASIVVLTRRKPVTCYIMASTFLVVPLCFYIGYNTLVRWTKLSFFQYALEYIPELIVSIVVMWIFLRDREVRAYYTSSSAKIEDENRSGKPLVAKKNQNKRILWTVKWFCILFAWVSWGLAFYLSWWDYWWKAAIMGLLSFLPYCLYNRHT